MKVKRFFAKDIREALNQVKVTFGEDAVILSNKTLKNGAEVVAAKGYEAIAAKRAEREAQQQPVAEEKDVEWQHDPAWIQIREEISSLRDLMTHQLTGLAWHNLENHRPVQAQLWRQLQTLQISTPLAQTMCDAIPQNTSFELSWQRVQTWLQEALPINKDEQLESGFLLMLGATGAGKTTTIAKLAAQLVKENSVEDVGLITTDSVRIGAHEQLRTYAMVLGVDFRIAEDQASFADALTHFANKRWVLIDTPGMNHKDQVWQTQMNELFRAGRALQPYLVLPATAQYQVLQQSVHTLAAYNLAGCIVSKLDEAISLGPLLSTVIETQLPIVYCCDGQSVPDDLHPAHAETLVTTAINLSQQSQTPCSTQDLAYGLQQEADDAKHA